MANRKAKESKQNLEKAKEEALLTSLKRAKVRYKKRLECIKTLALAKRSASKRNYSSHYYDDPELQSQYWNLSSLDQTFLDTYVRSNREGKERFWDFLSFIDKKSHLLDDAKYLTYWKLFEYELFWKQSYLAWAPQTNNLDKQYFSLVNHLFAAFPLPRFALNIWGEKSGKAIYIDWFFHLAEGKNIRTAEKLPFKLSPKMAHAFLSAPDNYSFEQAMVYGQLKSLKADKKLIEEVCGALRDQDLQHNEFWLSMYRFFITNPFLDRRHVQPVRDYVYNQKFLNNALQPNFSFSGREPNLLLAQVEEWHAALTKMKRNNNYQWQPTFNTFKYSEGPEASKVHWHVEELCSTRDLYDEGRALSHCVSSYAQSCFEKRSAILSLTRNGERAITLEINLASRRLIQARGKANRMMNEKESRAVDEWMLREPYFN